MSTHEVAHKNVTRMPNDTATRWLGAGRLMSYRAAGPSARMLSNGRLVQMIDAEPSEAQCGAPSRVPGWTRSPT
jgi:hypothetical protein